MRHVAPRDPERSSRRLTAIALATSAVVTVGVVVAVPVLTRGGSESDATGRDTGVSAEHGTPAPVPTATAAATGSGAPATGDSPVSVPAISATAIPGRTLPGLGARKSAGNTATATATLSVAAGSTAEPAMGGMSGTTGTVTPGTWVRVDAAAQAAATKAFFARTPVPVPATGAVKVPEFHATCTVSHHSKDDPIVFPGQSGAAHHHTFIGNETADASSTLASLLSGTTTCDPAQDHSAYWIPSLFDDGALVDPEEITVYYGSDVEDTSVVQPFPQGLRMITGDATNQDPLPQGNFWCSGPDADVGRTTDGVFPVCGENSHLIRQIGFPQCWDGVHLDSPDHKSHMARPVNGSCPADHPVAVPALSYVIRYPQALGHDPSGITLSSGNTYSMHADFISAWEVDALAQRVRNCLDQHVKCGADGTV